VRASSDNAVDGPSPLRGEGGAKRRVRGNQGEVLVGRARQLRRDKTDAERRFWNMVRNRSVANLKFVRQMPIDNFIVDFVCRERMLVVELDGSQHAESKYDERRTAILNGLGYSVLCFWNNEVVDYRDTVQQVLTETLAGDCPSPGWRYSPATLSPEGRGAVKDTGNSDK
jgi:very-short-patch-repair endonuclease